MLSGQMSGEESFQLGQTYYEGGEFNTAIENFNSAISLGYDQDPVLYYYLAKAHAGKLRPDVYFSLRLTEGEIKFNFEQAIKYFNQANTLGMAAREICIGRAWVRIHWLRFSNAPDDTAINALQNCASLMKLDARGYIQVRTLLEALFTALGNHEAIIRNIKALSKKQETLLLEYCLHPTNSLTHFFEKKWYGYDPMQDLQYTLNDSHYGTAAIWVLQGIQLVKENQLAPELFFLCTAYVFGEDMGKAMRFFHTQHNYFVVKAAKLNGGFFFGKQFLIEQTKYSEKMKGILDQETIREQKAIQCGLGK